jgi:hypothetical protein
MPLEIFIQQFQRDSLTINTLNKGEAHVIGKSDLQVLFSHLNTNILVAIDVNYQQRIDGMSRD